MPCYSCTKSALGVSLQQICAVCDGDHLVTHRHCRTPVPLSSRQAHRPLVCWLLSSQTQTCHAWTPWNMDLSSARSMSLASRLHAPCTIGFARLACGRTLRISTAGCPCIGCIVSRTFGGWRLPFRVQKRYHACHEIREWRYSSNAQYWVIFLLLNQKVYAIYMMYSHTLMSLYTN